MKKSYLTFPMAGIAVIVLAASSHGDMPKQENVPLEIRMDHGSHKTNGQASIRVDVLWEITAQKDVPQSIKIKLTSLQEGTPVGLSDLKEAHTKKIHALIFDQTLNDYQHFHPEPTKEPGVYKFDRTPKNEGT